LLLPLDNGNSFLGLERINCWVQQPGGYRELWRGEKLIIIFVCTRLARAGGECFILCYYFFHFFKVIYHFCKSHSLKFVLTNEFLRIFENEIVDSDGKSKIISWNTSTEILVCEGNWNPTLSFLSRDLKRNYLENSAVMKPLSWVVVDEFLFF
jgi:hypothetical protein